MKVTVCELNDSPEAFHRDWERLAAHVGKERSELVLLPEMPFFPWLFWRKDFDAVLWDKSVGTHRLWLERLEDLDPACVLGTRPENSGGERLNRGFIWERRSGCLPVHSKYYLPDEEGYWEATWYSRGDGRFRATHCGNVLFGFLICTDLWFFQRSRQYGKQGVHLVVCPRATPKSTETKWLVAGQAAAVVAGAFCLSSNRVAPEGNPSELGGAGWIIAPDGDVLGLTSRENPFLTLDIDLKTAEEAKHTYPRYVED